VTPDQIAMLQPDVLTVGELIDALAKYPRSSHVVASWEGIYRRIGVVESENGVVDIDADAGCPFEAADEDGEDE
jgi:hypothetical protein